MASMHALTNECSIRWALLIWKCAPSARGFESEWRAINFQGQRYDDEVAFMTPDFNKFWLIAYELSSSYLVSHFGFKVHNLTSKTHIGNNNSSRNLIFNSCSSTFRPAFVHETYSGVSTIKANFKVSLGCEISVLSLSSLSFMAKNFTSTQSPKAKLGSFTTLST